MARDSEGLQIKITGKPAIAILMAVAVLFTWRLAVTHDTVAPEVEERLRQVLAAEYASLVLPGIQESVAQGDNAKMAQGFKRLKSVMENITFPSLKSRGGRNHFYVRAQILVDGAPPPKGASIRYFQFHHSTLLGYVYQQEALALDYYVPFME